MGPAPQATPAAATAPPVDPIAQLRQLAELRDAGILTEEEFVREVVGRRSDQSAAPDGATQAVGWPVIAVIMSKSPS
ncbi:SHOCT domain-containing protein [Micromonospora costi]|uniref:SHOCT domain-containing protein n=1 Tax=Micromonospora costi TaxID=1530042 RepID=UPI00340FA83C